MTMKLVTAKPSNNIDTSNKTQEFEYVVYIKTKFDQITIPTGLFLYNNKGELDFGCLTILNTFCKILKHEGFLYPSLYDPTQASYIYPDQIYEITLRCTDDKGAFQDIPITSDNMLELVLAEMFDADCLKDR